MLLTRSLGVGGAERQLVLIARGLRERGVAVSVATFYGGPFAQELAAAGVPWHQLEKRGRWDVLGFLRRFAACVREERPEVVYSFLVVSNILASLVPLLSSRVRVVRGIRASGMDHSVYDWLARATFRMEVATSRFAHATIANSHAGLQFHRDAGYATQRMSVVPNGIDVIRFRPDAEARADVRRSLGVDDDTLLVGAIGRIDPMKDHPTFLRAAAVVSRSHARTCFVIAGDGPEEDRKRLESLADMLGISSSVQWLPASDAPQRVMAALDVFVSTSAWGEGFSNVLAEAMACGVPCVATDVGDAGVVLGGVGRLVQPGDPDATAAAILEVARTTGAPHGTPVSEARERIVTRFSVDRLIDATCRELAHVLAA